MPVQALTTRLLLAFVAISISACASLTPTLKQQSSSEMERSLSGRISVHYKDLATDHEETLHGRFDWQQNVHEIELSLLDPLGQTIALIQSKLASDNRSALQESTLTLRNGQVFTGLTPEALTERAMGWRVPLQGLRYWLDGLAAPDIPAVKHDEEGTPGFEQNGWTIHYPSRIASALPQRIDLSYPGPGVAVDLRLIIDQRIDLANVSAAESRP